ncbi:MULTISPECIES: hypothetical protein [unclassified Streptomyces]|uniref:hypothetical protein n=1 Tax=unclassified Streptomyces TaxID=2593676 RepID=UPI0022529488|nr:MULTISPECIES: hypothetical protein [unclassified Streptomyces]MCX4625721.1 hypothetical protein [Streptomyces sp. NBC_01443]
MSNTPWQRTAFTVGPLCMTAYGLIRLTDGEHGPGWSWSLGHLAFLAGVLCFIPIVLGMRRLAVRGRGPTGRGLAAAGTVTGLLGAAAVAAQAVIDLFAGFLGEDREAMREFFRRVKSHAGVEPAVYSVGPLLFYVGLLLLMTQLAALRRIAAWRPAAVVAGIVATGISLDLLPLAGLLFLLAIAPLGRQIDTQDRSPHTAVARPGT